MVGFVSREALSGSCLDAVVVCFVSIGALSGSCLDSAVVSSQSLIPECAFVETRLNLKVLWLRRVFFNRYAQGLVAGQRPFLPLGLTYSRPCLFP